MPQRTVNKSLLNNKVKLKERNGKGKRNEWKQMESREIKE